MGLANQQIYIIPNFPEAESGVRQFDIFIDSFLLRLGAGGGDEPWIGLCSLFQVFDQCIAAH